MGGLSFPMASSVGESDKVKYWQVDCDPYSAKTITFAVMGIREEGGPIRRSPFQHASPSRSPTDCKAKIELSRSPRAFPQS